MDQHPPTAARVCTATHLRPSLPSPLHFVDLAGARQLAAPPLCRISAVQAAPAEAGRLSSASLASAQSPDALRESNGDNPDAKKPQKVLKRVRNSHFWASKRFVVSPGLNGSGDPAHTVAPAKKMRGNVCVAQEEKAAATKVANTAKKNAKAAEGSKSLASFFTKKPAATT